MSVTEVCFTAQRNIPNKLQQVGLLKAPSVGVVYFRVPKCSTSWVLISLVLLVFVFMEYRRTN